MIEEQMLLKIILTEVLGTEKVISSHYQIKIIRLFIFIFNLSE